jgi:hypothetical protein
MPVPWEKIAVDGVEGCYHMIELKRMPSTICTLTAPADWTDDEQQKWQLHIYCGQNRELADENVFQFLQPRPGQFNRTLCLQKSPDTALHYPPESLAYALRLKNAPMPVAPLERPNHLPFVSPNQVYIPWNSSHCTTIKHQLGADNSAFLLMEVLEQYESFGPHQVGD